MKQDTRQTLLAAAELILVRDGATALTVRKIGMEAGANPGLVTYHFKSVRLLLEELALLNLQPIRDGWDVLNSERAGDMGLEEVLRAWLGPLTAPAAFTPGGRALIILDEIGAHGEMELRRNILAIMQDLSLRLRELLRPHLPHLARDELRARLRFIAAAALGPPPRDRRMPAPDDGTRPPDDLDYLLAFAKAGLSG